MKTTRIALVLLGALALLAALPATAEYHTVKLKNGNELDTLYRPRLAEPNGEKVLMLTATGNWISLRVDAIESVISHIEARGFGKVTSGSRRSRQQITTYGKTSAPSATPADSDPDKEETQSWT